MVFTTVVPLAFHTLWKFKVVAVPAPFSRAESAGTLMMNFSPLGW